MNFKDEFDAIENNSVNDLDSAIDDLGINKEDVLRSQKITFKITGDKLLDPQNICREYKATMEGKTRVEEGNSDVVTFKQTGKALAPKNFIHLTNSLLNSFSDPSNISSNKNFEQFFIQLKDAFYKVKNMCERDENIRDREASAIMTLFKQKLVNIGQIITNEDGNMKLLLERLKDLEKDSDFDLSLKNKGDY